MKRRDFVLSGLGALAGSALVSRTGLAQVTPQRSKVIVIGGGLSGLVAAYELNKLKFDVTVLEAQSRPGGRILTLRNFDEPGLHAEAGAARIPNNHDLTLKYVREFDLPLAPFYPTQGKFVRVRNGRAEHVDWGKFEDAISTVMFLDEPENWQKIRGGNDQLPRALVSRLGARIRFNSPVVRIEQGRAGVTVKFREQGAFQSTSADLVICAIPFTTLSKIEISPGFSAAKADAIRSMVYDSASRVFVETRRRTWLDQRLNGFAFGDDAAEVWDSTFGQPGTHGIIQSYLRGGFSIDLMKQAETARIESRLVKLENMFPGIRANFVKGISKCWSEDPWVFGAWAHPDRTTSEIGMKPEGRIFFAGEHLSDSSSWMQGAIQSALRVLKEVTAVPGRVSV